MLTMTQHAGTHYFMTYTTEEKEFNEPISYGTKDYVRMSITMF